MSDDAPAEPSRGRVFQRRLVLLQTSHPIHPAPDIKATRQDAAEIQVTTVVYGLSAMGDRVYVFDILAGGSVRELPSVRSQTTTGLPTFCLPRAESGLARSWPRFTGL
ncbi:hypothetical protein ACUXAV_006111 [Cupriavidus metallidurans]|jgi:hypothetical protein|nr:hypothetical protein AU374_00905 [Cupriavidus metallidurans]